MCAYFPPYRPLFKPYKYQRVSAVITARPPPMALQNTLHLFLALLFIQPYFSFSKQVPKFSQSFNLISRPLSTNSHSSLLSSLASTTTKPNDLNFKTPFKYTMALIVSLPIGTPPQTQQMVLDTGSQLSWIKCHEKRAPPSSSAFNPSLSSTFSVLPCTHPVCKPRVPDFTLPTSCDQNRLCHYSYFYADGTYAEGNLVREKISFSNTQTTPPLILGCSRDSEAGEGILGINRGRLSFSSQSKITKFSYCVPSRGGKTGTGTFYIGENPHTGVLKYVSFLNFGQNQHMPNFDYSAYTVGMEGISLGGKRLNISRSVFLPDAGGSGQTMIDSGSEYTYLVQEAYVKLREEVVKLVVGPKLKSGYVYQQVLDLCYTGDATTIGRLVGDMVLEFGNGAGMVVKKENVFTETGGGVSCLSIGRSDMLGVESNIIGNFHQQNQWVEYDLVNRRVGVGPADCGKEV